MSNSILKGAILEQRREKMGNYTRPNIQRRGLGVLTAVDTAVASVETLAKNANTVTYLKNAYDEVGGDHGSWTNAADGTSTVWTINIPGTSYDEIPNIDLQTLTSGSWATASSNITWAIDDITGNVTITAAGPAYADQVLTLTGNLSNTETITIDTKVYTLQTTLTDVDGNVLIGATAADTIQNLFDAINLTGTPGTQYATAMTIHPTVRATANDATTLTLKAKEWGTVANTIATTETSATASFGAATLAGGTTVASTGALTLTAVANNDTFTINGRTYTFKTALSTSPTVADEILIGANVTASAANVVSALNGTAGLGTTYSVGTEHNLDVRASSAAGVVTVRSRNAGSAYDAITTTETGAATAWGGATLGSGAGTDNRANLRITIK